ncbi:MAG: acyl-ACP desaturase [Planctomycetota bacterium]|nr:acyl-ACP desaturase [Planctomycetota bacterium]
MAGIAGLVDAKLAQLSPVNEAWQPSDYVPDLTAPHWVEELTEFRKAALELPDDLLVVLVGTAVTEEALPSYQTSFNRLDAVRDATGADPGPWARWSRAWTAEENRHGDLLNRYLYLTGRVDMRSVEVTIQHLIRNGFDPGHDGDPYNGLVYTTLQEQATRLSHAKVGKLARQAGEKVLGQICNVIAGDEARHENAYRSFMGEVFERDPDGAVMALDAMLQKTITMPAKLMEDGSEHNIFACFSGVAQRLGVYTFTDYIQIIEEQLAVWNVAKLKQLSGPAAQAQERVCSLPHAYRRRAALYEKKLAQQPKVPFRWIQGRIT